MADQIKNIALCRRLLGRVKSVRFSSEKQIDLSDRFALVTIAAGLRTVAAFGFRENQDEQAQSVVKGIIEREGLCALMTSPIHRALPSELPRDIAAVFEGFDAQHEARSNERLLWVFSDPSNRVVVERVISGEEAPGVILGYPTCCVEQERNPQIAAQDVFRHAIVNAVGSEPEAIRRALREDLEVELPADTYSRENAVATARSHPFVFHIACDECLASDNSATSEMDRNFRALAQQVDRTLFQGIVDMAEVDAEVQTTISEAEAKGLGPETLDSRTKSRLQGLFRKRDKIHGQTVGT